MAATENIANQESALIVGIFNHGEDAQRALTELKSNGFRSNQIGAAFRVGTTRSASGAIHPASYATAGDAAGATAGATDPSFSEASRAAGTSAYDSTDSGRTAGRESVWRDTGTTSERTRHAGENWWERLKNIFTDDEHTSSSTPGERARVRSAASSAEQTTGADDYDFGYESSEFEGTLAQAGVAPDRASDLARGLPEGGAILTVRAADRGDEAQRIIQQNNGRVRFEADSAARLEPAARSASADDDVQTARTGSNSGSTFDRSTGRDRIQLFGEVLRVHKDRISRGEVVIRKEVITENQTIEVPVTREEFVIETVPVKDGRAADPGTTIGSGKEIRVPLSEEKVSVEKLPVVREEVRVGKREVTGTQSVGDQLRHEELRVDEQGGTDAGLAGRPDTPTRKTA